MGLKDAFVNIAASAITSRVNSAVGGVLDAAFGSKGRASASGPAAALDNKTRFTTDNLAYPINVEGDPMQGHYILFSAREQDPAKLKTKVKGESPAALGKKINAQNGIGQTLKNGKAAIKNSPIKNLNVAALKNAKGNPKTTSANAITTSKIASSRVTTTIALYMPPSVAVSYDSKYADAEIGNLAQFGMEAFNTLSAGGDFSDMGKKLGSSVKERGGAALKKGAVKAADAAAPGAAALIALERGKIVTPKMELMFEGIGRRSFSFSFVFIPKSEAEAISYDTSVYGWCP
jgi:hypothetical protein